MESRGAKRPGTSSGGRPIRASATVTGEVAE